MSQDELRTRAIAAMRQRVDLWQTRLGKNPLHAVRSSAFTGTARFFFDPGEAATIAAEVRRRLPSECQGVIRSANQILTHRFNLLGYNALSFGDETIEWNLDPVHGIRAPEDVWFRLPYLDFHRVGDHKVVWELSRHQHLTLLARAWLYSGEPQFLHGLQSLWTNWREENPYPRGINWASALEVAFRCLSWIWVDHLTFEAASAQETFRAKLREAIGECAVYIERYISTYFAPNTHLMGEALALFFVGVLYPEFERAQTWREYGWNLLIQESSRQILEDGFHFEQSTYYHVYAIDMFLQARILAARNEIAVPESYDATLCRMAEGLASVGAAGVAPRFGDDDGGRLFDGRRNLTEHMLDPLAAAAIVYSRGDWKYLAGDVREETIWLLGTQGVSTFDQLAASPLRPESRAFPASGYHTMASENALLVIDAGPHGWGNGGHGHADALSLQLISHGKAWLTDPGTGSYPYEKPERNQFRSTAAHNTLEVDGVSQADPIRAFAWASHPTVKVEHWYQNERIALFHGRHDGYSRLSQPVMHDRWVIGWHNDVWMVLDCATGRGAHRLDLRWHFAPECKLAPDDLANTWQVSDGVQKMEMAVPEENAWRAVSEMGNWSPNYGAIVPAPVIHLLREGALPSRIATVFGLNQPRGLSLRSIQAEGASGYIFKVGELFRLVLIAEGPEKWKFETIESDASCVVLECSPTAVTHLLVGCGTTIRIGGERPTVDFDRNGVGEWVASTGAPLIGPAATSTLLKAVRRHANVSQTGDVPTVESIN